MLVQRRGPHLDQPAVGPGLRRPHLEHLRLDMQLVAWPHRTRPAQLLEPEAQNAPGRPQVTLDQHPHGRSRGMPTACRQASENTATRGYLVEVEGLWVELRGEAHDSLLVDSQPLGRAVR